MSETKIDVSILVKYDLELESDSKHLVHNNESTTKLNRLHLNLVVLIIKYFFFMLSSSGLTTFREAHPSHNEIIMLL
ncbi:hypothetical protein K439DRAFT_880922 [Ramaria rubella]|nr:hypothetical protein K439DRAFT_880922 [Ramaria rubella]